jgi:hypothetical protein
VVRPGMARGGNVHALRWRRPRLRGLTAERLPLALREWRCTGCGAVHHRDAAVVRIVLIHAVGQGTPEPAPAVTRKRAFAVRGGTRARASGSQGGPAGNAVEGFTRSVPDLALKSVSPIS